MVNITAMLSCCNMNSLAIRSNAESWKRSLKESHTLVFAGQETVWYVYTCWCSTERPISRFGFPSSLLKLMSHWEKEDRHPQLLLVITRVVWEHGLCQSSCCIYSTCSQTNLCCSNKVINNKSQSNIIHPSTFHDPLSSCTRGDRRQVGVKLLWWRVSLCLLPLLCSAQYLKLICRQKKTKIILVCLEDAFFSRCLTSNTKQ